MIIYQLWVGGRWVEVSKQQYVAAERHAGLDDGTENPATSAFGNLDTGDWGTTHENTTRRKGRR